MKRIRIEKDLYCRLAVLTNGEVVSLEGEQLTLYMVYPSNEKVEVEITEVVDNVLKFHITPEMQKETGVYGFETWKNIESGYQTVCDRVRAFELVPLSVMEGGVEDWKLETETVDITTNFSGDCVIIDNLESDRTDAALSANQGRVIKEMIETEEAAREDSDKKLQDDIDALEKDVEETYETKKEAKEAHDELQSKIELEEGAREKADDELTAKFNKLAKRLAFLCGDTVSWVTTDEYLIAFTDSEDNLLLGITKEAKLYIPVGLPDGLVGLREILEAETKTREAAEQTLQDNIDALQKAVDETYETKKDAQEAYDKLQEEIDKLEETGSATYETKDEAKESHDELQANIDKKQDILTAGFGIDITNNVVSSTIDTNPFIFVEVLPTEGIEIGKIYCTPDPESTDEKNIWDEWYWIESEQRWEAVGKYIPTVDMTLYEKTEDANAAHKELQEAIEAETTARETADSTLQDSISNMAADISSLEDATTTIIQELQALSGDTVKWVSDDNYLLAAVDSEDSLLFGITKEAKLYLPVGLPNGIVGLAELLKNYASTSDIPTNVSQLTNDSGYITTSALTGYAKTEDIPTKVSELENDSGFITDSALSDYAKTSDVPTNVSQLNNDSGYITSSALDDYAKTSEIPTNVSQLNNDSGYITESALSDYAKTSDVPTKVSELTNDSGYITSSALDGYAKESDVPTKVSELTNDSGYITESALSDYASKESLEDVTSTLNELTEKVTTLEGDTVKWVTNDDYLIALVDSEDSLLMGIGKDGSLYLPAADVKEIEYVSELPSNPVNGTLYLIPE